MELHHQQNLIANMEKNIQNQYIIQQDQQKQENQDQQQVEQIKIHAMVIQVLIKY